MDRFELSILRSYYGGLLTKRQDDMLRMRYDEDMSLGEIAVEMGVSRQTVLDTLEKGEKHLVEVDAALGLIERDKEIKNQLDIIASPDGCGEDVLAAVKKIKEILEG